MKKTMTHQKEPWVEWLRIAIPNTEFHSSACNDVWYAQPRKLEEKRECFCGGELRYRKCIKDVENLFSRQRKEFEEAIAHAKREERKKVIGQLRNAMDTYNSLPADATQFAFYLKVGDTQAFFDALKEDA